MRLRNSIFCGTTQVHILWDYTSPYFVGLHKSIFCKTTQFNILWDYTSPYLWVTRSNFVGLQKSDYTMSKLAGLHLITHVQLLWDYRSPYFVGLRNVHNCGTAMSKLVHCSPTNVDLGLCDLFALIYQKRCML